MKLELSPKLEDYLETIYRIAGRKKVARPRDISKAENVAKSTVTAALRSLAEKGLINYEPYEVITLTEKGRSKAENIMVRHIIIKRFLQDVLRFEARRAEETACKMEHALDQKGMERFVCFLAFLRHCSADCAKWLDDFHRFLKEGSRGRPCRQCVEEYLNDLKKEGEM